MYNDKTYNDKTYNSKMYNNKTYTQQTYNATKRIRDKTSSDKTSMRQKVYRDKTYTVLSHHPSSSSPCFSQNRPPTRWLVWGKPHASLWLVILNTRRRLVNRASQRLASGLPQTNHLVGGLFWLKHGEEPLGWCDSTVY